MGFDTGLIQLLEKNMPALQALTGISLGAPSQAMLKAMQAGLPSASTPAPESVASTPAPGPAAGPTSRSIYNPYAVDLAKPTDEKSKTYKDDLAGWQALKDQTSYAPPPVMANTTTPRTLQEYENYYNKIQGLDNPYQNPALAITPPRSDDPASAYPWYKPPPADPAPTIPADPAPTIASVKNRYMVVEEPLPLPLLDEWYFQNSMFSPDSFATGGITDSLQYLKRKG